MTESIDFIPFDFESENENIDINDKEASRASSDLDIEIGSENKYKALDKIGTKRKRKNHQGNSAEISSDNDFDDSTLDDEKKEFHDSDKSDLNKSYTTGYDGTKLPPWLLNKKRDYKDRDISRMLNDEMKDFVEYISPTAEEHAVRQWILEKLTRILENFNLLKDKTKKIMVVCFGSYLTGLYLPTSDLDVTVCVVSTATNEICEEYEDKVKKKKLLYQISHALRGAKFSDYCEIIGNARVPIIKTKERYTNVSLDISINSISGLKTAKIVNHFLWVEYPEVLRGLAFAVKMFLHQRCMNEVYTGGLGSYAVVLLLVSFLQHHPRCQSKTLDLQENIGVLLCEFFELYGKRFNYDSVGISIADGGKYVSKGDFKGSNSGYDRRNQAMLYLEDPGDSTNDVTKGTYGMTRIKQSFSGAFDMITNSMFKFHQVRKFGKALNESSGDGWGESSKSKTDLHSSKKRHLTGKSQKRTNEKEELQYDLNKPVSFLGSIINVSNQVIRKRTDIASIFYNNVFQEELKVKFNPTMSIPSSISHNNLNVKEYVLGNAKTIKDVDISFVVPSSPDYVAASDSDSSGNENGKTETAKSKEIIAKKVGGNSKDIKKAEPKPPVQAVKDLKKDSLNLKEPEILNKNELVNTQNPNNALKTTDEKSSKSKVGSKKSLELIPENKKPLDKPSTNTNPSPISKEKKVDGISIIKSVDSKPDTGPERLLETKNEGSSISSTKTDNLKPSTNSTPVLESKKRKLNNSPVTKTDDSKINVGSDLVLLTKKRNSKISVSIKNTSSRPNTRSSSALDAKNKKANNLTSNKINDSKPNINSDPDFEKQKKKSKTSLIKDNGSKPSINSDPALETKEKIPVLETKKRKQKNSPVTKIGNPKSSTSSDLTSETKDKKPNGLPVIEPTSTKKNSPSKIQASKKRVKSISNRAKNIVNGILNNDQDNFPRSKK
ncbi:hypothetical protein BB558_006244 [Smittium angustum]|uniref:polynucleotide adenylyltransferase n=2 Tax=Harpellales TaxID=61421 RepID=A0A2U1IY93_SMIAN|nr:hypothetical protein BB558_006244 [Smittium angustum]